MWFLSEFTYFDYVKSFSVYVELEGVIGKNAILVKFAINETLSFINIFIFGKLNEKHLLLNNTYILPNSNNIYIKTSYIKHGFFKNNNVLSM